MEPEGLTYYSRLLQVQVARWGGWGPHSFHSCHFYPNRNNLRYPYICIHILHMCTCSAFPSFSFSTDSTVFRWMINSQWEKQLLFRISPPPPLSTHFRDLRFVGVSWRVCKILEYFAFQKYSVYDCRFSPPWMFRMKDMVTALQDWHWFPCPTE